MSAFGPERTFHLSRPMSAFGGKADVERRGLNKADVERRGLSSRSVCDVCFWSGITG
jgi:hypothetical protein